jgi:hypothetical protein
MCDSAEPVISQKSEEIRTESAFSTPHLTDNQTESIVTFTGNFASPLFLDAPSAKSHISSTGNISSSGSTRSIINDKCAITMGGNASAFVLIDLVGSVKSQSVCCCELGITCENDCVPSQCTCECTCEDGCILPTCNCGRRDEQEKSMRDADRSYV